MSSKKKATGQLVPASNKKIDVNQGHAIKKLLRKVGKLESAVKADTHFYDYNVTGQPGNTATVYILTPIAQGDGENNRDGEAISLKYLDANVTLTPNSANLTGDSARIVFFKWKSATNGSPPSAGQLISATTNVDSKFNRDYRESLVVLKDIRVDCSTQTGKKIIKVRESLHNSTATYVGTTSADWNEGQVFMLIFAEDNTNKLAFSLCSRVLFSP